jgi:hypothetical protein
MNPAARCVKTPKGIEEMTQRKHGLSQRHRRLLILVDGSRALNDLVQMVPDTEVPVLYQELVDNGFIAPLESQPVAAPAATGVKPAAPAVEKRAPAPADDRERFEMARNFMYNTTSHFLGVAGSSLSDHIQQCNSIEELRNYYKEWSDGIRLTGDGRKAADKLEQQLAGLIS